MVFNSYVSLPEGTSRTNHQNSVYFSIRWSISLVTTRSITTCFDKNGAVQPWNPLLFTFKIASKKTQILVCMIVHHCKIVHNISILMLVVFCCHIHNYVYIHMYFNHFQPTPVQPALQNLGTFWWFAQLSIGFIISFDNTWCIQQMSFNICHKWKNTTCLRRSWPTDQSYGGHFFWASHMVDSPHCRKCWRKCPWGMDCRCRKNFHSDSVQQDTKDNPEATGPGRWLFLSVLRTWQSKKTTTPKFPKSRHLFPCVAQKFNLSICGSIFNY